MGIRVFVFDCGGVVLRDGDLAAYAAWESRLGLQPGALRKKLWNCEAWGLAECGQLSDREYWAQVGRELGLRDDAEIAAMYQDLWNTWIVDPQVLGLIDRLRQQYRVAMLSNATDALEDLLAQRYQIADRFEVIVNSARVGVAKPHKAIYEELLRRLDASAEQVMFIDDRAENVAAAAALGMHIAWFVEPDELERQLEPYLRTNVTGNAKGESPHDR